MGGGSENDEGLGVGQASETDGDDLSEFLLDDDPLDPETNAAIVRPELIEKALKALYADAERGEGELERSDVNRTYLRRQLSITECMEVEGKLISAGIRIIEKDETPAHAADTAEGQNQRFRYLSEIEEKDLGRKIQLAFNLPDDTSNLDQSYVERIKKDAELARAAFLLTNMRYVEQIARRQRPCRHLNLDDIMQEGFLGLLRATDLYDPERGFRFKTYATWWIEQKMQRAIADDDRLVRLPVHVQDKFRRIKKSETKLTLENGKPPTLDELATAIGTTPERLTKLFWRIQATESVEGDAPVGEDTTLLSLIPDHGPSPFDIAAHQELQQRFTQILATLTPREERVLRMRYGIGLDMDHTLESIGQQYNVTRERIRQIEAKAFKRLQHSSRKKRLTGFLDS
jgi:RNA polymerase primary sigma factor